jgi:hypothetical protein
VNATVDRPARDHLDQPAQRSGVDRRLPLVHDHGHDIGPGRAQRCHELGLVLAVQLHRDPLAADPAGQQMREDLLT